MHEGIGSWTASEYPPVFESEELRDCAERFREVAYVVTDQRRRRVGVGFAGEPRVGRAAEPGELTLRAVLPPMYPEWLGSRAFCETHGTRFAYVAGEMANGIATTELVVAMARSGMLGFFGAAGLAFDRVEQAVVELERRLGTRASWGVNLIHSPNEPELEERVADMLIERGVARVSASAFMTLTPAIVRYSASGLRRAANGDIVRRTHVFAKLSRPELAQRFMAPAPKDMLEALVARGKLSSQEAELAALVPVAQDITVEADSGGHTDNRTLTTLFPCIVALRGELSRRHNYARPIRLGAAGGLGTPAALAAAFALGADYVITGSVNQAALESGLSDEGKLLLSQADLTDITMAPAADMFELGVKVQVLKRATMFAARATKLYEAYLAHASVEAIPATTRARLEREVLGASFDDIWAETKQFWQGRAPAELARAQREPKHRLALMFRWYLGKSSRWAIDGESARRLDYQIWCGSAMGAFNQWVRGSFLANPERRSAEQIALNLLEGAAAISRAQQLRAAGVDMPGSAFEFSPRPLNLQPDA